MLLWRVERIWAEEAGVHFFVIGGGPAEEGGEDLRPDHAVNGPEPTYMIPTELDMYRVIPTKPVSPLHVRCKTKGRGHARQGAVLWPTQTEDMSVEKHAAENCFWDLTKEQVANFCRYKRVDISKKMSLPAILEALIKKCITGITPERVAAILALRAMAPPRPAVRGPLPRDAG